jgi:hypothetical protein
VTQGGVSLRTDSEVDGVVSVAVCACIVSAGIVEEYIRWIIRSVRLWSLAENGEVSNSSSFHQAVLMRCNADIM